MSSSPLNDRDFYPELVFTFSRSSGPGGQNVNKVSTKAGLQFHIMNSGLLTKHEKALLTEKLAKRINNDGELILVCQSERTQLKNKEAVIEKFYSLVYKTLKPRKKRKPTRPSAEAKEKRLENKRIRAKKKEQRSRINP